MSNLIAINGSSLLFPLIKENERMERKEKYINNYLLLSYSFCACIYLFIFLKEVIFIYPKECRTSTSVSTVNAKNVHCIVHIEQCIMAFILLFATSTIRANIDICILYLLKISVERFFTVENKNEKTKNKNI